MKSFSDKGVADKRVYSVGLKSTEAPDATYTGTPVVTISVYDKTSVPDPDASEMLEDGPAISTDAITIEQESVPLGRAISQKLSGGVIGCTYIVHYECDLSDGQRFVEDVQLHVAKYVPTP